MSSLARATFKCGARGCNEAITCDLLNDSWYTVYVIPQEWHVVLGMLDATKTLVRCPSHCKWVSEPGPPYRGEWEVDPGDECEVPVEEIKFYKKVPQTFSSIEMYKSHKIEEWSKMLKATRGQWAIWPFPITDRVAFNKASDIRNNKLKWFRSGMWEATTIRRDGSVLLYVRYLDET